MFKERDERYFNGYLCIHPQGRIFRSRYLILGNCNGHCIVYDFNSSFMYKWTWRYECTNVSCLFYDSEGN